MKRNFIIRNIILAILILVIVIVGGIYLKKEIDLRYKIAKVEEYNYFVLKSNERYGVIDKKGNVIVEAKFDNVVIPNPEKDLFVCCEGKKTKILNSNQEEKLEKYNNVEAIRLNNIAKDLMYEKTVLKYLENGKYGLLNMKGKKITKAKYDEIEGLPYKEGELLVKENGKYGVINIKGNTIVKPNYDAIKVDEFYYDDYKNAGYIVSNKTENGYRYGYLNRKGKELLKTEYNDIKRVIDIEDENKIYLIVAKDGQYGIIINGKTILNHEYQSIEYNEKHKVFILEKSKKYGIANIKGEVKIEPVYDAIDTTGIYLYGVSGKDITVYDNNGNKAKFDTDVAILKTENEKFKIKVKKDKDEKIKYGLINEEMVELIKEKYGYLNYLYKNYFVASKDNIKFGIINDKDETILPMENDQIQKIGNTEMVKVKKSDVVQIYSTDMQKVCEMKNANIEEDDKYIKVYNDAEIKYFNNLGKELSNKEVYTNNKLFLINKDGKYGYSDANGKTIIEPQYERGTEFNEYGFAGVLKEGKWQSINEEGKILEESKYDEENFIHEPEFLGKYYKYVYGFGEIYYTDDIIIEK